MAYMQVLEFEFFSLEPWGGYLGTPQPIPLLCITIYFQANGNIRVKVKSINPL